MTDFGLTPRELRAYRALRDPARLQRFLEERLAYNKEPGVATCLGPRRVLREGRAHCMEGALFAAAALRVNDYPPLLVDLESVRDDDHVLAVFRRNGCWGAVAKSNYAGLRFREPVYRSLRELAMSYFEDYYNLARERTLRAYSRPVNLARFDRLGWMTSEADLWAIPEHLCEIPHIRLLRPGDEAALSRKDRRGFDAGRTGSVL